MQYPGAQPYHLAAPTPSHYASPALDPPLRQFITALGLARYLPVLEAEELDMDSLLLLSESDLAQMGLARGPRAKIMAGLGLIPARTGQQRWAGHYPRLQSPSPQAWEPCSTPPPQPQPQPQQLWPPRPQQPHWPPAYHNHASPIVQSPQGTAIHPLSQGASCGQRGYAAGPAPPPPLAVTQVGPTPLRQNDWVPSWVPNSPQHLPMSPVASALELLEDYHSPPARDHGGAGLQRQAQVFLQNVDYLVEATEREVATMSATDMDAHRRLHQGRETYVGRPTEPNAVTASALPGGMRADGGGGGRGDTDSVSDSLLMSTAEMRRVFSMPSPLSDSNSSASASSSDDETAAARRARFRPGRAQGAAGVLMADQDSSGSPPAHSARGEHGHSSGVSPSQPTSRMATSGHGSKGVCRPYEEGDSRSALQSVRVVAVTERAQLDSSPSPSPTALAVRGDSPTGLHPEDGVHGGPCAGGVSLWTGRTPSSRSEQLSLKGTYEERTVWCHITLLCDVMIP